MAPRTEFSTEQIRNKARKDLLYLLEGVSDHSTPRFAIAVIRCRMVRSLTMFASRFAERKTLFSTGASSDL